MSDPDETVTVVSYNRPLTRGAYRALDEYGIVEEQDPGEYNRHTVVELETEPPADVLDKWELRVEREPDAVFQTDHGERVEVYDDAGEVRVDGGEQSISPEDARDHAANQGWERVDDTESGADSDE